jgi:SAM-dependent methyltransferase
MSAKTSRRAILASIPAIVAGSVISPAFAQWPSIGATPRQVNDPDLLYVPTPDDVIARMFELAKVTKDDLLIDLGSGDGRIPIQAAQKLGTRGRGVDLIDERVEIARANAKKVGVEHLVKFEQGDALKTKIDDATVVTMYLFPHVMMRLRPRLETELKSGTRIVSHEFTMGDWKPVHSELVGKARVHMWVVP